jgi:hypothetical protein
MPARSDLPGASSELPAGHGCAKRVQLPACVHRFAALSGQAGRPASGPVNTPPIGTATILLQSFCEKLLEL